MLLAATNAANNLCMHKDFGICSNYFVQSRLGIASRIPSFRQRSKGRQQNGARWHPPSKLINERELLFVRAKTHVRAMGCCVENRCDFEATLLYG